MNNQNVTVMESDKNQQVKHDKIEDMIFSVLCIKRRLTERSINEYLEKEKWPSFEHVLNENMDELESILSDLKVDEPSEEYTLFLNSIEGKLNILRKVWIPIMRPSTLRREYKELYKFLVENRNIEIPVK